MLYILSLEYLYRGLLVPCTIRAIVELFVLFCQRLKLCKHELLPRCLVLCVCLARARVECGLVDQRTGNLRIRSGFYPLVGVNGWRR